MWGSLEYPTINIFNHSNNSIFHGTIPRLLPTYNRVESNAFPNSLKFEMLLRDLVGYLHMMLST